MISVTTFPSFFPDFARVATFLCVFTCHRLLPVNTRRFVQSQHRRRLHNPRAGDHRHLFVMSSKIVLLFALFALCALFSVSEAQYYSPYYSSYGYGYPSVYGAYGSYGYGLGYYGGAVYGKREAGFAPKH